ncbi:hypothetical protein M8J76_010490 [Diaphorina citri]|nr:hypothetical protein M8J76_010490 [Diaphorina citri]
MMSIRNLFIVIIICTGILVVFYLKDLTNFNIKPELLVHSPTTLRPNLSRSSWLLPSVHKELTSSLTPEMTRSEIVVALVVCGDRLQETLNLVKSALIFQLKNPLRIIILAEDNLIQSLEEKLGDWQVLRNHTFKFEIHNLKFPKGKEKDWKNLFKKCAAQRLFLPDILSHIDSVLYMDIDTLFLGPVLEVWRHFYLMNATQMAALVPEGEDVNSGWYSQYARHPYYGNTGVNSGVMLMNLTRMRSFGWVNYLGPIFKEFRTKIPRFNTLV